jgi:hypothetical protein
VCTQEVKGLGRDRATVARKEKGQERFICLEDVRIARSQTQQQSKAGRKRATKEGRGMGRTNEKRKTLQQKCGVYFFSTPSR